ncbi:hypothetical protein BJ742DRAFT_778509 [Cladochytrium replicatum]|nr:hypothetical protein BJ742DRAFT_778509 [Cladochytrium replicatum]
MEVENEASTLNQTTLIEYDQFRMATYDYENSYFPKGQECIWIVQSTATPPDKVASRLYLNFGSINIGSYDEVIITNNFSNVKIREALTETGSASSSWISSNEVNPRVLQTYRITPPTPTAFKTSNVQISLNGNAAAVILRTNHSSLELEQPVGIFFSYCGEPCTQGWYVESQEGNFSIYDEASGRNVADHALMCVPCPINTFERDGFCVSCPNNTYSPIEGSVTCASCGDTVTPLCGDIENQIYRLYVGNGTVIHPLAVYDAERGYVGV